MDETTETSLVEETNSRTGWKLQFGVLCGMLVLALIGMGLSQALEQRAWWYWLFVVITYAVLGLWRSIRKAKRAGDGLRNLISRELAHWSVLLVFLGVLAVLERKEIISRESSSDFALLLLAFSCCLAGIHFDWLLLIMGVVLTVMLVAMATLEQYTIVLWIVMIVVAAAAAGFFYLKSSRGRAADGLD
ncbi:hypothetical protein Q31b_02470 [Novipirellula aureliae]|uniref:Transmembrane protein n=1 Tax=Novipirellula aureliae TaxID=2527966 RepID=A0A5C6EC21_9BACT|nr:hypothetical protein [Novipirellula aureliae]TWU45076.1 hypothetical protein Q31b_02470 [Novipirellula aureliae]